MLVRSGLPGKKNIKKHPNIPKTSGGKRFMHGRRPVRKYGVQRPKVVAQENPRTYNDEVCIACRHLELCFDRTGTECVPISKAWPGLRIPNFKARSTNHESQEPPRSSKPGAPHIFKRSQGLLALKPERENSKETKLT